MVAALQVPWCEQVADLLSEYIDGELDASSAARVTIHLVTCIACARFAAELAATVDALHWLAWRGGRPTPASRGHA